MKLFPVESTKSFKAPSWFKRSPESGNYWYDIYRADRTPKRLCRSTGISDNKMIALKVAEREIAKWMGTDPLGDKPRFKFKDAVRECMESYGARYKSGKVRAGTWYQMSLYINRYLLDEFGMLHIDEIERAWHLFETRYRRESPGKSLYNHWKHMSLVMNFAYRSGLFDRPWLVRNPEPSKKVGRVISEDQKQALIRAALPELRDQLMFAMTMGMRLREHLHLSWDRVNMEEKTITLRPQDTKTHKGRVMVMSPAVYDVLVKRSKRRPASQWVFPARGRPSQPCQQNKNAWATAKRKAKITGRLRYHDLRHTFLTECAKKVREGKVSLALVCSYAGLNIAVFERVYLHLNHKDTAGVAELIAVNPQYLQKQGGDSNA